MGGRARRQACGLLVSYGDSTHVVLGEYQGARSWYDACIFRRIPGETRVATSLANIPALWMRFHDPKSGMLEVQELLTPAGWRLVGNGDELTWRLQNNRIAEAHDERHVFEWTRD